MDAFDKRRLEQNVCTQLMETPYFLHNDENTAWLPYRFPILFPKVLTSPTFPYVVWRKLKDSKQLYSFWKLRNGL